MRIPKFYKWIIKYITPTFLLGLLSWWVISKWDNIILKNVTGNKLAYMLYTRLGLLTIFVLLAFSVRIAWKRKAQGISTQGETS